MVCIVMAIENLKGSLIFTILTRKRGNHCNELKRACEADVYVNFDHFCTSAQKKESDRKFGVDCYQQK